MDEPRGAHREVDAMTAGSVSLSYSVNLFEHGGQAW